MHKSEEIKVQAVRLMAEMGFEALSLRQLAAAAGLRPGSIYTHYQSKAQLLCEVCCDYLEDLLATWQERRQLRGQCARQQLLGFVAVHIAFARARPQESRIVRLDARSLDEAGRALVDELRRQHAAELESILYRGVQEGVFHMADVQVTSLGVLYLLQGFAAAAGVREAQASAACAESVLRLVGACVPAQLASALARGADLRAADGRAAALPG
ncbi:Bacterial regulatory protein [compost metagenome]